MTRALLLPFCILLVAACTSRIDRHALVSRHNPEFTEIDPHAPLMVGNGSLGFTADITGLQTYPEEYSELAPLLTMAQWAWHSFPNPEGYTEANGLRMIDVPGRGEIPYSAIFDWSELESNPALVWLRENPHRYSLARISFDMRNRDGKPVPFEDLTDTRQELDLWTGVLHSSFSYDGEPVRVETSILADNDTVSVSVSSELVARGQLRIAVRYPGVSRSLNPDPSDFADASTHRTTVLAHPSSGTIHLLRELDGEANAVVSEISADAADIEQVSEHTFIVSAEGHSLMNVSVSFSRAATGPAPVRQAPPPSASKTWPDYWSSGGVIDFTGSTDSRAAELERRIVLSQYLMRVNASGAYPPQEEGLFSNSWNGKFHLEMHAIHAAHFAQWGRPEHLEQSLQWYLDTLPVAMETARRNRVRGAWWTKMAGPGGRNSPSTINPFIMWQQPHPIYMSELVWRAKPDELTLLRYGQLVEETANLLASWPLEDANTGRLQLGPPISPVQENHPPLETSNPAFELEYYRFALEIAQKWRRRRGKLRNADWDNALARLPAAPVHDGLLIPVEGETDFWGRSASATCSRNALAPECENKDHPSFMMAFGFIEGSGVQEEVAHSTLEATTEHWDLRQTWGWDFPILAMSAARLGDPEQAIDWLFADYRNNQWGSTGMTPRIHLEAHAADLLADATPEAQDDMYRRAAEAYFPSNGALLLATGMMAAGWTGSEGHAPGFPDEGWTVRVEGIDPLP